MSRVSEIKATREAFAIDFESLTWDEQRQVLDTLTRGRKSRSPKGPNSPNSPTSPKGRKGVNT